MPLDRLHLLACKANSTAQESLQSLTSRLWALPWNKETAGRMVGIVASPQLGIPFAQWLRLSWSMAGVPLAQPRCCMAGGPVTVSSQRLALVRRCAMAATNLLCHGYNVYTARCARIRWLQSSFAPSVHQADGPRWAIIRYTCFTVSAQAAMVEQTGCEKCSESGEKHGSRRSVCVADARAHSTR
jgi:hypothetical protein